MSAATNTGGNRRVQRLLESIPHEGRVLDLGCVQHDVDQVGAEDWLHGHLAARDQDVVGVDILENAVEDLRERGYNVVAADVEGMDLGEQFDIIVAGELIEHLSNPGQFLDCVHDHLRPGGVFVASTPNPWAFHRFKQALFGDVNANPEHTCWFDERTVRQLFERHGFDVSIRYVEPSDPGITSVFWWLGAETIGGTSLLVHAVREELVQ